MELRRLRNKKRFVEQVASGEFPLIISGAGSGAGGGGGSGAGAGAGRRLSKAQIVAELEQRGFDRATGLAERFAVQSHHHHYDHHDRPDHHDRRGGMLTIVGDVNNRNDNDDDDDGSSDSSSRQSSDSGGGRGAGAGADDHVLLQEFDYLLSMPLWSFTDEQVVDRGGALHRIVSHRIALRVCACMHMYSHSLCHLLLVLLFSGVLACGVLVQACLCVRVRVCACLHVGGCVRVRVPAGVSCITIIIIITITIIIIIITITIIIITIIIIIIAILVQSSRLSPSPLRASPRKTSWSE